MLCLYIITFRYIYQGGNWRKRLEKVHERTLNFKAHSIVWFMFRRNEIKYVHPLN